jgi:CRP-like cAMP-binding protein/tRNA A-37 threonylcarbamoyl transferase component Bud32
MNRLLEPGSVFGRYHVVRPIGSGGMAAVYEARHVDLHKHVALKVLHAWLALRLDVVQRFVLEARAASRFSHDHVVRILDIGSIERVPFMAMDLLEGESLAEVLDRDGPLPLDRLADVMLPVLSAVATAHEAGVLHRDLKPDNIFLARRGRRTHPMLLDFGISKVDSGGPAQPLTAAGEVLGTPPYMSPEQVQLGMTSFDARSDQYGLGVVLYECSTGRLPFYDFSSMEELMHAIARGGAPPPSSVLPGLPAAFDAAVARAMSLAPRDRFPSVLDLARALLPFAGARARDLWTEEFGEPSVPRPDHRPAPVVLSPAELRALPLLDGVPDAELLRLPRIAPALRVAPRAALFDQGTAGTSCFVVVSGELELSRTHGADTWEIEIVRAGTLLGLPALWDNAPRPVSAIARTESVAVEIRRSALAELGAECPEIADRLHAEAAATAVRRLKGATNRIAELLDRPSVEASRETLVRLAAATGEWSAALPRLSRRSGGSLSPSNPRKR